MRDLWVPGEADTGDEVDLGQHLLGEGAISRETLDAARRVVRQTPGLRLETCLLNKGADERVVYGALAAMSGVPLQDVAIDDVDPGALERLGLEFCQMRHALPLGTRRDRMVIGTTCAHDVSVLDEVRAILQTGRVTHVLMQPSVFAKIIDALKADQVEDLDVQELLAGVEENDVEVLDAGADEEDDGNASPVVRYVNHVIQTAVREGASDIHIEPCESNCTVRYRVDGVLYEAMNPPRRMHASITSRIKIMASLDIAERRLPQDGRIRVHVLGRPLDLRVSTAPTPHGEKTVMRLLDNRSIQVPLDELGFQEDTLEHWRDNIARPHGILLVTGPTGSGKTTTLYGSMQELDLQRLNVSTVEDPVEYQVEGVTQMQTHDRIGLTFASALRTMLRQDPDVIMVGEIRDQETATIAIQAALTGHLVLSTLHTNDAPSSVTRLINIGIEPFLVSGAVNAILAQRLMRRVCSKCVREVAVSDEASDVLARHGMSLDIMHEGAGCSACRQTGHAGRLGIHEMLVIDDALRDTIAGNPTVNELRTHCVSQGMRTLREDALLKMADGKTSLAEVLRVT